MGSGAAILLLLILYLGFMYISYMGMYVIPQRYATMASPSGKHRLLVMRTLDPDEQRVQIRKAARLEADPDGDGEDSVGDWGYVYRAYPQVLGFFYRSNADVEGEVCMAIDNIPGVLSEAELPKRSGGTLMVEWLDDEATAHFFVEDPGPAEGGDCYVRF